MEKISGGSLIKSLADLPSQFRPENILVVSGHLGTDLKGGRVKDITYFSKPPDPKLMTDYLECILLGKPRKYTGVDDNRTLKVDVTFVNPFIDATLYVLQTTCSTKAQKDSVFVRGEDQISGDISAIIAFNSSMVQGSMAISFDENCYLNVMSRMLGENYSELTPEIQDGVGEICNQVFGQAKIVLNAKGFEIGQAIPSVVVGEAHTIKHLVSGPCIAVRFLTDSGSFTVEAALC